MTDYDSRSTWDSGLDAGSTPARSTALKDATKKQPQIRDCFFIHNFTLKSLSAERCISFFLISSLLS